MTVKLVMGITDIDDKIIDRSNREHKTVSEITREYEKQFVDSLHTLNIRFPERFMRVSDHISDIIDSIAKLTEKGVAYQTSDDSVYFSVPRYTEIGHQYPKFRAATIFQNEEKVINNEKRDCRDFALWKAAKSNEPIWESPWGMGRPGWHIECSAIVRNAFGDRIDLHSGGIDLEFPHHENEIAQSETIHGHSPWCPFFIHTGHLHYQNTKMSKSLGNIIPINELLRDYMADDFRMLCLLSHYRDPLNFTEDKLGQAAIKKARLAEFTTILEQIVQSSTPHCDPFGDLERQLIHEINEFKICERKNLLQDFGWPKVVRSMVEGNSFVEQLKKYVSSKGSQSHPLVVYYAFDAIRSLFDVLGFQFHNHQSQTQVLRPDTNIINEVVSFRSQVRSMILAQMEAGNPAVGSEILRLCDKLRSRLGQKRIRIMV